MISIIIPTYNRAHLIGETLDSMLVQTYTNWECIVVDDGSTDATDEVLKNYSDMDNRIQYHHRPENRPKGANSCRNYGFEISKGEYVKWFDSDDIMKSSLLQKQLSILNSDNSLDFCALLSETFIENTNIKFINKANRIISHHPITSYLVKNHYFLTGAPLWRRSFLDKQDYLFDEKLSNSDESDFHFRIILNNPKYIYTDGIGFSVRRGNSSVTQDRINKELTLLSRFLFFNKVYKKINEINFKDKDLLLKYTFSRLLTIFYELSITKSRFRTFRNYFLVVLSILFKVKIKLSKKIKIFFGLFSLLFFGKGYSLIKIKIKIREKIEN